MNEGNDNRIQHVSNPNGVETPINELTVITCSNGWADWSQYLGKYHINFLCSKGSAHFSSSSVFYQVSPSDFVAWSVDMEISEVRFSDDFQGMVLIISRNFLIENNPQSLWATKGYLLIKASPVIHLSKPELELLESDINGIKRRESDIGHLFKKEILGKYLQIYLLDLWDICKTEISLNERMNANSASIFSRFLGLAQQYALTRREVAFYAAELCVTAKYLSEVSRKASGKSALYWINGYAVQEIMALLRKTNLSIAEISEKCCFFNPSHFSRYFKKFLGVSPTEYRLSIENHNSRESIDKYQSKPHRHF